MYGMLAFALLENGGRMREAEVAAKRALEIDPLDVWGQHAVRVCCYLCANRANYDFAQCCSSSFLTKPFKNVAIGTLG